MYFGIYNGDQQFQNDFGGGGQADSRRPDAHPSGAAAVARGTHCLRGRRSTNQPFPALYSGLTPRNEEGCRMSGF